MTTTPEALPPPVVIVGGKGSSSHWCAKPRPGVQASVAPPPSERHRRQGELGGEPSVGRIISGRDPCSQNLLVNTSQSPPLTYNPPPKSTSSNPSLIMAKGARSSVRKTNNQKLKKNVFGPVEDARTKRLSEKLLELAQQPRPAKDDMEIEKDREPRAVQSCHRDSHTNPFSEPADDAQPQETEAAGLSIRASWPVPHTLEEDNHNEPTAQEHSFYQLLGLSNIVGFGSKAGEVTLEFLGNDQIG